ncbi:MAG TPA: tail fiber domain-containing protein [Chitinophagaceae bacterium]
MKKFLLILLFSNFLIASAQNVGIGTTNPFRAKLEVHGGVGPTSAIFGGDSTGISLQRDFPTIGFNEYYNNGHKHIAKGYAAQQFLDPKLGYMAIDIFQPGTANGAALNPRRALAMNHQGKIAIGDGNSRVYINGNKDHSLTPATLEIRQFEGYGIALIDPWSNHYWQMSTVVGSPPYMELRYDGALKGVFKSVTGEYVVVSDARLKKNVESLPTVLEKVMQLQPVKYEMINNNTDHQKTIGFIAQDVKEQFPELVTVMKDSSGSRNLTNLHTLNYSGLSVVAIKALQEQQQVIEAQQKSIRALEAKIEQQGEILKFLLNRVK